MEDFNKASVAQVSAQGLYFKITETKQRQLGSFSPTLTFSFKDHEAFQRNEI